MSEPKDEQVERFDSDREGEMDRMPDGPWVRYTDYESQARQIATLTAELEREKTNFPMLKRRIAALAAERDQLKVDELLWKEMCDTLKAERDQQDKELKVAGKDICSLAAARDRAVEALKLISEYSATSNMDLRSLVRYKDGMIQIAVNALADQPLDSEAKRTE